ncbi:MAG: hypothetical protein IKV03_01325 [Alphaproteobacteria bacterium]|nr:hypothetical protein [Alphaproteobacteria bacterium]
MCKYLLFLIMFCSVVFFSNQSIAKIYSFEVNAPRELDFATIDDVFRVRKNMIKKYPIFFSGNYNPLASSAFAQVKSKKPWWGVEGMACYGPGQKGIEGVSEESRFIDNPFSLISIEEGTALRLLPENKACPSTFVVLSSIQFDDKTKTFTAVYNVSSHLKKIEQINKGSSKILHFSFNGLNAIDFGVPYVYAMSLKNVEFLKGNNLSKSVYRFKNFIHLGGSCGYTGGCNNGSPYQPETTFSVQKFPAQIVFKLWKNKPKSISELEFLKYKVVIN